MISAHARTNLSNEVANQCIKEHGSLVAEFRSKGAKLNLAESSRWGAFTVTFPNMARNDKALAEMEAKLKKQLAKALGAEQEIAEKFIAVRRQGRSIAVDIPVKEAKRPLERFKLAYFHAEANDARPRIKVDSPEFDAAVSKTNAMADSSMRFFP